MLPKRARKILYVIVFGGIGLWIFDWARIHTSQPVLACKNFAEAVLDGRPDRGRKLLAEPDQLMDIFTVRKARNEGLKGERRLWVYYRVKVLESSKSSAMLSVKEVYHIDRFGANTFFGSHKVVNRISARMVKKGGTWKVQSYQDNYFRPGMKDS